MKLKFAAKHAGKILQDNSPTILSAVAVVGVAATGYFTWKASKQHAEVLFEDAKPMRKDPNLSKQEEFLKVWKLYIPAVTTGVVTVGCIVMSNRIHASRLAALGVAYGVLSGDFDEYREKASNLLTKKQGTELKEKLARGKIEKNLPSGTLPDGKSWFYDQSSGRMFASTMETVKGAQNDINYTLNNHGDASLNDFYAQLGLDATTVGDILGWKGSQKLELVPTAILTETHGAVTSIQFKENPVPKFWQ